MTTFTTFLAPDIEYGGGANAIKSAYRRVRRGRERCVHGKSGNAGSDT